MKSLWLLAILLMGGCAWGQTKATCAKILPNGDLSQGPCELMTPPKPEPMDVPAVKARAPHCFDPNGKAGGMIPCGAWTCADKSRFLMTAEDGSKHCIKFPKEQP